MLYVFVEGPDDSKFINSVFSLFLGEYRIIEYSHMPQKKLVGFVHSIDQMPTSDYVFLGDSDGADIEVKRERLQKKYTSLTIEKIFIVQFEIESWYYAGVSEAFSKRMKMKHFHYCTDALTKEEFYSRISSITDRKYIMGRILDNYELDNAVKRNNSLSVFCKYIRAI